MRHREKVKDVAEEVLGGPARELQSASELVGKGCGGARGINPFSIESLPRCSQENKDEATLGSPRRGAAPSMVVEYSMLCPYTQAELVDMGSCFWQKPSGSVSAWLLCLWDVGVDGIILSGLEIGKLAF